MESVLTAPPRLLFPLVDLVDRSLDEVQNEIVLHGGSRC